MKTLKICLSFLLLFTFTNCSNKSDVSGKWIGSASETKRGKTTTMNFELILSQNEKSINGSLTLSTPENPRQSTTNMQGFIENEMISLTGDLGSMLGSSIKMTIQGTLKDDKIIGKFSVTGLGGESLDIELNKVN